MSKIRKETRCVTHIQTAPAEAPKSGQVRRWSGERWEWVNPPERTELVERLVDRVIEDHHEALKQLSNE